MKRFELTLLFGLLIAGPAQAEGQARAMIEDWFGSLDTLAADFSQLVTDRNGQVVEEASGRVYLKLPDKFRWDYTDPYEQVIVADGEKVWLYDVELEQVTVRNQSEAAKDSPMLVLADTDLMDKYFETEELGVRNGAHWLGLTPKSEESQFRRVEVAIDENGLRKMEFLDRFGQLTTLTFDNLERNAELEAGIFEFTPPEGVDVIGDVPSQIKEQG